MKLKYRKKNPQKQGRILEGEGEEFFWLARIYTPGSLNILFFPIPCNPTPAFRGTTYPR